MTVIIFYFSIYQLTSINIFFPVIQCSSWFAFSKTVLQILLCSEDREERKAQEIIKLRNDDEDTPSDRLSVRTRITPAVNPNATSLLELIDWSDKVNETPLTCKLKISEIRKRIVHRETCETNDRGFWKSAYS